MPSQFPLSSQNRKTLPDRSIWHAEKGQKSRNGLSPDGFGRVGCRKFNEAEFAFAWQMLEWFSRSKVF